MAQLLLLAMLLFSLGFPAQAQEISKEMFARSVFQIVFDQRQDEPVRLWGGPVDVAVANARPEEDAQVRQLLEEFSAATGLACGVTDDPATAEIYILFTDELGDISSEQKWLKFKSVGSEWYFSKVERDIRITKYNPFVSFASGYDDNIAIAVIALERSPRWRSKLAFGMAVAFGMAGTSQDYETVTGLPARHEHLQDIDTFLLKFMYSHLRPKMIWRDASNLLSDFVEREGVR